MKDQNPNASTPNPGRTTGPLEQLPPTKKRDLRTGSLNPAVTQPSFNSLDPSEQSTADQSTAPTPPAPTPMPPAPTPVPTPPAPEPAPKQAAPSDGLDGLDGKTTEIEMSKVTSNFQVVKEPAPARQFPAEAPKVEPPKAALPERAVVPSPAMPSAAQPDFVRQHTVQTEVVLAPPVSISSPAPEPGKPLSAAEVQLFGFGGYLETPSVREPRTPASIIKTLVLASLPVLLLLGTAIGIIKYVPGVRDRLPVRVASMFGSKSSTGPQVSIQEYRVGLDEKENSATIGGVVKNLSDETIGPLQVEIILFKREDVRITETKLVPLEPTQLGPNQEAKYELKISAKDYQQSKFSRVLNGGAELRVKKLGIIEPKPQIDPGQAPASQAGTSQVTRPKGDPNQVYEGSVTFR